MTAQMLEPVQCGDPLIHDPHEWGSYEPASDDPGEDGWVPVRVWCGGNADQDDPMDRFECCVHCGPHDCPRRDGHPDPCLTPGCPGTIMLGEAP